MRRVFAVHVGALQVMDVALPRGARPSWLVSRRG